MQQDNGQDGIRTISSLVYKIDKESENPADNVYIVNNERIGMINIQAFMTLVRFETDKYHEYDLRDPLTNLLFPENAVVPKTYAPMPEEAWKKIPPTKNRIGKMKL